MLMSGLNQSAVRRVNTSVILRTLADSADPMTLSALAERAGLSRRTNPRSSSTPSSRPAG